MRRHSRTTCGILALASALAALPAPGRGERPAAPADPGVFEVLGKTRPAPGRKAVIAPVPLHPVVEVRVRPGDRVRKGQLLVRLDADEPEADVRARQAALDSAAASAKEARRYLGRAEELHGAGNLPEGSYHQARLALLKAEADERAARAALESAKAELEHYEVTAMADGVVSWLDVHPGTVSRPGTTVWGEILDLREVDARCEVTPDQADRLAAGQEAEVRRPAWGAAEYLPGKVAYVGVEADAATGLVPVLVRLANPGERLRCGVPVTVRFGGTAAAKR
jgi:RND family efflux transporter MFP subunit